MTAPKAKDVSGLPWPEVAAGEPGPLYGVFGEEDFLVDQALGAFLASPAFATNPDLNNERFAASDGPPVRVIESASTLPFLSSRRLVICTELQVYKAAELNEFLDYLRDPAPSACLVFAGARLDTRTKFGKTLSKTGKVHNYKKLFPKQLSPWLRSRAQERQKALTREAADRLAELSGLGLSALDSEIEKLALYCGERREIVLEDVLAVTGRGRLYSIFDFTDALAAGSLHRALSAHNQLAALGEPEVRVLAMVSRLFRQMIAVRQVLDQGGGEGEVQRTLRIPPAATRTLVKRARDENAQSLARALASILEADLALKSAPGKDQIIMERLVFDLCAAV